ncbi:MAG: HNH endonuclease domain-containing protein [Phycisphaerales bacterium]|nr:HNH endonuclease domain-containing protein [Phycisphaerales bacterium]
MAKFILGLDIGTNSIGWVLFKDNKIFDKGVIIFPIGTNVDKNGIESTKNMERGTYRRASRTNFRYKLRRKDLKKFLASLNMLPTFSKTFEVKEKYQASELYQLRAKALSNQIPIEELGRIFLLINKHRGFKSNSKTLSATKNKDEDGKVKGEISELSKSMVKHNARTIGEYFHKMYQKAAALYNDGKWHNIDEPFDERALIAEANNFNLLNSRGIRREGRFVGREMYATEFDLIWDEQKKYYPQLTGSKKEYDEICKLPVEEKRANLKLFKETFYWKIKHQTIFFQRPLKSQKKFIGKCQFEKNKRTAPASSLLFQDFRIWKQLADVRYTDKTNDIYEQPLPPEWKQKVFDYLQTHLSLSLRPKKDNSDILELLGITNKKNFEFNYDSNEEEKSFQGNKTLYAIYTACGEEKFNQLKQDNKLDKLWHILYMAKDDEWLYDTLTWKWEFDPYVATKLVEMGLEEGFANYSSKVLEKILPFLKEGKDEHEALVETKYKQPEDEDNAPPKLKPFIVQLKNNELRNPVVEKAVGETIRLVNTILKSHDIDQKDFTIRVESTREFKKPKKEREGIRRKNLDTEKRREEYARFLNEKKEKGELSFSRYIQKNDSIINKFELWLELGADKNDPEFKEFEKIVERRDREKHTLWLDCNRICPYTGNIIPLSKLFSPEIEIEHIIPYSWSLDDSFTNKTLTFGYVNKEKANKSAYEYMQSKGKEAFKAFQSRVKANKLYSKEKVDERFLTAKPEQTFTNAQGRNASYIAVYVRKKLQEVCRDVQFTNGFATGELRKNDWRLGNLLDKVRYQEETGIDVDKYTREFANYKRDFEQYRKRKANSTDINRTDWRTLTPEMTAEYEGETKNPIYEWWEELQKFDAFRGAKGKKDRSDHRHHLLDAIIIGMCSRSIIQRLSTLNQLREKQGISLYDEKGELTRERIDLPIPYAEIKEALQSILVYHKAEQRLITAKQNRIRKKKHSKTDSSVIKQRTIAPRGSLVGDNFYGKLKNPQHQGFTKDAVFVKRITVNGENFKDKKSLDKIVDKNIKKILELRLDKYGDKGEKAFSEETLLNDPLFVYSIAKYPNGLPNNPTSKNGNTLPTIKKIRVANKNSRNLIQLLAKDEEKKIVNENRYSEADGNYVMALYESKEVDTKGKVKIKRGFEIVSFFKSVERRRKGEKLFPDEKEQKDGTFLPLMKSCPYLKAGDFVIMYENEASEIDWDVKEDLMRRMYMVTQLASSIKNVSGKDYLFGNINFAKHNVSKAGASYKGTNFKNHLPIPFISNYYTQLKIVKVQIDRLGNIKPIHQ